LSGKADTLSISTMCVQTEKKVAKGAVPTATIDPERNRARKSPVWRFAPITVIAAGFVLGYILGWHHYLSLGYLGKSQDVLKAFVADHPALAPVGFVACYVLAVAFSFPAAAVLTIFGGFLFGWALGAALAVVAATSGATLLFLAARTAFGDYLKRRLGGVSARLAEGFEKDAFSFLLVLRLAPFVPFVVVNVAPALFNVRLRTFVAATAMGIIPGAIAYAWLGEGVDSVLVAAKAAGRHAKVTDLVTPQITIAFAALALVALIAVVVKRRWKRDNCTKIADKDSSS
jgi:uncharacterized membrane protein YdjX (TVP38/TMEM64 family)